MLDDFKKFLMRGNVVDLAVGVIIGAAFGKIVGSLVDALIMPVLGLALGRIDFSNLYLVLKAGTDGHTYVIRYEVTTTGGDVFEHDVIVTVSLTA